MFSKKLFLLLVPLCTAVLSEEEAATVYGTEVVQNQNTRSHIPAIIHSVPRPIPPPIFVQPLPNSLPGPSTPTSESAPVQIRPTIPVRPYYRPWGTHGLTPTYTTQSPERPESHDTFTTPTPIPIPIPTAVPKPYNPPARPTYRPPTYYTQATIAPTSPEPSTVYVEPLAEPTQASATTDAPTVYNPSPRPTLRLPYNPLDYHPTAQPEPIPEPTTVPPPYTEIPIEYTPLVEATQSPIAPELPLIPQSKPMPSDPEPEPTPMPTLPTIREETTTLPIAESPVIYVPRATVKPAPSHKLLSYQPSAYPFDHEYSYCNEENSYQPIEETCSMYRHCRDHRAIKYSCPDGLHFDITIIYPNYPCNNPAVVRCKYSAVEPSHKPELPTQQPNPTFRPPVPTREDPPTTENYKPTVQPHIEDRYPYCSEEYGYYPVENKCASYIQCKDHRAIEQTCPDGLHYDEKINYPHYPCSNPSDARCKYYKIEPSHVTELPTPQPRPTFRPPVPTREDPPTTEYYKPTVQPHIEDRYPYCSEEHAYYPVDNKCASYIQCRDHRAIEQMCPDGLHYDGKINYPNYPCSNPAVARCRYLKIEPSHVTELPTPQPRPTFRPPVPTREDPPTTEYYKPTVQPHIEDRYPYCSEEHAYYPVDNKCASYNQCRDHRAIEQMCPDGLHYDEKINYPNYPCSNPAVARCRYYKIEPSHVTELPTPQPRPTFRPPVPNPHPTHNYTDFEGHCERRNGYLSIQGQCDAYIECKNSKYMEYLCPDGLYFNPDAVWPEYPCSYPSEVQCRGRTIIQTPRPTAECMHQYGFYPIGDNDCSRFLSCQEGQATIMNCPTGLVFNPDTSTCDWPENVPSCRPDAFKGFVCPETPRDEYGQPTDLILNYRYGDSCIQYIACRRGHPRLLSCEDGFAFDDSLGVCVDQSYVQNCSFKKIP